MKNNLIDICADKISNFVDKMMKFFSRLSFQSKK